jgi:hypothetical protein
MQDRVASGTKAKQGLESMDRLASPTGLPVGGIEFGVRLFRTRTSNNDQPLSSLLVLGGLHALFS